MDKMRRQVERTQAHYESTLVAGGTPTIVDIGLVWRPFINDARNLERGLCQAFNDMGRALSSAKAKEET